MYKKYNLPSVFNFFADASDNPCILLLLEELFSCPLEFNTFNLGGTLQVRKICSCQCFQKEN